MFDAAFFRRWLVRADTTVDAHADWLTELDSPIGDADHGSNLRRGFAAVTAALDTADARTPKAVLVLAGKTLIGKVGGASGPLYGTALRTLGRSFDDQEQVTAETLGEALDAAVSAVGRLGESAPGEKTMLDALSPAADAFRAAVLGGHDAAAAGSAAAEAAEEGARGTIPIVARKGRAAYLGERSAGHEDPGAASVALLLGAFAAEANDAERQCPGGAPGRGAGGRAAESQGTDESTAREVRHDGE